MLEDSPLVDPRFHRTAKARERVVRIAEAASFAEELILADVDAAVVAEIRGNAKLSQLYPRVLQAQ